LTRIADGQDPAYRDAVTALAMKFQQFTGPVMAKGLEDTAFYRYNRLVSLNDVGSDLHRFGTTTFDFHAANQERLRDWPHTMLATSTHDSKRSEDVRARINVLSEMPGAWRLRVRSWARINLDHKRLVNDRPAPSANDEYLLYQTLLGAWPVEPLRNQAEWKAFSERIENYLLKAMREAKQNTSWINQNTEYEEAVSAFVKTLLNPNVNDRFLSDFVPFQKRVARIGIWNSLSQTLLKLTCPGVPDIYQGTETFDFSLVDPDNRRPVDYVSRQQMFGGIGADARDPDGPPLRHLLETPEDGRLKLYLIWKTLCLRKRQPDVFHGGDYLPLAVEGAKAKHLVAFVRTSGSESGSKSVLVAVPRLVADLLKDVDAPPIGPEIWQDTYASLPGGIRSAKCKNAFTGEVLDLQTTDGQTRIAASSLFAEFPVALCSFG